MDPNVICGEFFVVVIILGAIAVFGELVFGGSSYDN